MRSIIVYGIHTLNVGDDLFLRIVVERYPNVRFIVYAPEVYKKVFQGYKNLLIVSESDKSICAITSLSKLLHVSLSGFLYFYLIVRYRVSLFLIIGGSLFIEGNSNMPRLLSNLSKLRILKPSLKICIIGTNYGPSKSDSWQNKVGDAISIANDVCFRDKQSYSLFSQFPNVRWGNDIVFHMISHNFQIRRKEVCVNIRSVDTWPSLKLYKKQYLSITKEIIEDFQNQGYGITILSFCEKYGDNLISDELFDSLSIKDGVKILYYNGNLNKVTETIASAEYMVASRFHAIILSLFYGVKVLPVSYSIKTENMLKTLGCWNELYSFDKYCESDLATLKRVFICSYQVDESKNNQFEYLDNFI